MALTIQQLQANLDTINQAIGSPTLKVRFPDGRELTYRSMDELRKAKAEIEEDIRRASGQTGSRVRFAQHQRGDGPTGPTLSDRW
jgi:hypothetical protein